jgi:hypothetical protein
MTLAWKPNWEDTKQHFVNWWNHEGLVLCNWARPTRTAPHEPVDPVPKAPSVEYHYSQPRYRADRSHHDLAWRDFPLDTLPLADTMIGPGSLALLMGSEPGFSPETVWFNPCMDPFDPERYPPLRFDPANRWQRIHEQTMAACMERARGRYLVGCPDLVENIDILAALRDPQRLLMDLIERPDWVEQKVWEINEVFFQSYQRIYDIIKLPDGSSCFEAFMLWAPGKVAKVQCDASAMFSVDMFARFVAPALTAQCEWLDYSMFHLDGHQCIQHLDVLLGIEALDAIEWTPDPQVPGGGSAEWYPMYRRILDAGKSVQAIGVRPDEVEPLLDEVGGAGMYIGVATSDVVELERLEEVAERYRVSAPQLA